MAFIGTPLDTRNTFQSLVGKRFSGDGSTTAFTLDVAPGSVLDIEVFVGNVRQDPNSAYTLSGTTLTFTGAPPSGTNNVYVVHQAKSVGTIDVPALGVSTASIQADAITEAKIADDAVESEHLNNNIISGQTELAAVPALTDEILISDAGTLKRIDYTHMQTGWVKEFESTLSGDTSGTIDIETTALFDGTYDYHCIKILRLQPENDDKSVAIRTKFGGSYKTDAYYRYHMKLYDENSDSKGTSRSTNRESIDACAGTGNADSESTNGVIYYASPDESSLLKPLYMRFDYVNTAGRIAESSGVGYYANANTALQGIRLLMLSGNGSSSGGGFGDVTVAGYGLKK